MVDFFVFQKAIFSNYLSLFLFLKQAGKEKDFMLTVYLFSLLENLDLEIHKAVALNSYICMSGSLMMNVMLYLY